MSLVTKWAKGFERRLSKVLPRKLKHALLPGYSKYAIKPLNRALYITVRDNGDGFGSQFQAVLSVIAFAEAAGIEYIHTPLTERIIEHNYGQEPDFEARLESLMSISRSYRRISELPDAVKKVDLGIYWNEDSLDELENQTLIQVHDCNAFMDQDITHYDRVLSKLRADYLTGHKPDIGYFAAESINVAVHIRRTNAHDSRDTLKSDSHYQRIIKRVRREHRNHPATKLKPLQFHIYSQGELASFQIYAAPDVMFHINEPVALTFHAFVMADILVTSRSSLSYVAALLSQGKVYYTRFWHTPMDHWIAVGTPEFLNSGER